MQEKRGAQGAFASPRSVFVFFGRSNLIVVKKRVMNFFFLFIEKHFSDTDTMQFRGIANDPNVTPLEMNIPVTIGVRPKCLRIPRYKMRAHMCCGPLPSIICFIYR